MHESLNARLTGNGQQITLLTDAHIIRYLRTASLSETFRKCPNASEGNGSCDQTLTRERAQVKVQIHGAILRAMLRAMAELHRVSTPKFVARNIAAVESRPTSVTLRATNFFVYPPSAAFRAIV